MRKLLFKAIALDSFDAANPLIAALCNGFFCCMFRTFVVCHFFLLLLWSRCTFFLLTRFFAAWIKNYFLMTFVIFARAKLIRSGFVGQCQHSDFWVARIAKCQQRIKINAIWFSWQIQRRFKLKWCSVHWAYHFYNSKLMSSTKTRKKDEKKWKIITGKWHTLGIRLWITGRDAGNQWAAPSVQTFFAKVVIKSEQQGCNDLTLSPWNKPHRNVCHYRIYSRKMRIKCVSSCDPFSDTATR